jgi:hypothetical protein
LPSQGRQTFPNSLIPFANIQGRRSGISPPYYKGNCGQGRDPSQGIGKAILAHECGGPKGKGDRKGGLTIFESPGDSPGSGALNGLAEKVPKAGIFFFQGKCIIAEGPKRNHPLNDPKESGCRHTGVNVGLYFFGLNPPDYYVLDMVYVII